MELGFACGKTDVFIERQPNFLRFIEYSLLKDGAPLVQFGSTEASSGPTANRSGKGVKGHLLQVALERCITWYFSPFDGAFSQVGPIYQLFLPPHSYSPYGTLAESYCSVRTPVIVVQPHVPDISTRWEKKRWRFPCNFRKRLYRIILQERDQGGALCDPI